MRILLIEDNPGDAELVRKALTGSGSDRVVESNVRLRDALNRQDLKDFDVILADLSLPDSHGLQCVKELKAAVPESPVVVLTSLANDEVAESAIEEGAQDYLVKDRIDGDRLERSIRYAIQRQRMIAENERLLCTLRESKNLLEKKNRRLERVCDTAQQFVDNVSHDFRTPLTVIMEYASLLRDAVVGDVNEEQRRLLDIIDDRASDLNTMVDDMLDVSRLEAGLLGAWRGKCRVDDVVHHVLPSLQRKAEVCGVSFETALPDDLPLVFCDADKAGRVIVNLVVNAIKFSGEPGVVRLWADHPNEHEVCVGVTDNGPGIPAERVEEMFRRFSQLSNDLRLRANGFGLGLNIAQELVSLNFGQLSVESSLGAGSTFKFTLPIANPVELTSRFLQRIAKIQDEPMIVSVVRLALADQQLEGQEAERATREIEALVNSVLRQNDLMLRQSPSEWLLLVATSGIEVGDFLRRIDAAHTSFSRNRPQGPLPAIESNVQGSWHVVDDSEEILSYITQYSAERELCYADS